MEKTQPMTMIMTQVNLLRKGVANGSQSGEKKDEQEATEGEEEKEKYNQWQ